MPAPTASPSSSESRSPAAASLEATHGPTRTIMITTSAILTALIFAFDVLSPLGIAIAALYIVVLLMSLRFADLRGIVLIACGCIGLTIAGYLIGHANDAKEGPLLRCIVSVLAITIAAVLCVQIRMADAKLRRSEERYRNIFQSTSIAIWEQDYSAAAALCEPFLMHGLPRLRDHLMRNEDFLRRCLLSLRTIDANDAARFLIGDLSEANAPASWEAARLPNSLIAFREILLAYLAGQKSFTIESAVRATDGSRRELIVTATFPTDRTPSVLISSLDVTAQIAAEQALQQSASELTRVSRIATLGALTASIGHEVNQPLAAVVTNGEAALRWLGRDEPDLDEVRTCIEETVNEGRRAAEIIQRLRSLSVKGEHTRGPVDLNDIVTQVHAMARRDLADHGIATTLDLAIELPDIHGDGVQLQQVTMNLVNNAIHAMKDAATRRLCIKTAFDSQTGIQVTVSDSGLGISEGNMQRLFAPFFTTKNDGMGIGLSISRSIIETHRGRIWAERHPDGGTSFHFMIPTTDETGSPAIA
jgi:two-component system, LuxR family, sensor kinase FixL